MARAHPDTGSTRPRCPLPRPAERPRIALYEAEIRRVPPPEAPLPSGSPLPDAELAELLAELPPIDQAPPLLDEPPEAPVPAPPLPTEQGPLSIVRATSGGEHDLVSTVSVTFSHEMVPLPDDTDIVPPARLDPPVEGRWRWLDTRTLALWPASGRLPMATTFTLSVPAATRSLGGAALPADFVRAFSTPPPRLRRIRPTEERPGALQPVIALLFDQQMDPDAVLAATTLSDPDPSGGTRTFALRRATPDEIEADEGAASLARAAPPGCAVALRPTAPLPRDATLTLTLAAGPASAEGPRPTAAPLAFALRTHGAFRFRHATGTPDAPRPPDRGFRLRFAHALDPSSVGPETVSVTPPVPGLSLEVRDDDLELGGDFEEEADYTVTVSASLRDRFGQALGAPLSLALRTGRRPPALSLPGSREVVLDPSAGLQLPIESRHHDALKVVIHAVQPEDWPAWRAWSWPVGEAPPPLPGRLVHHTTVRPGTGASTTWLDLRPWLPRGLGHLVVLVRPSAPPPPAWPGQPPQHQARWVQATGLGLTAIADGRQLLVRATELATGAPAPGTEIALFPSGASAVADGEGLARLPLPGRAQERERALLAARGDDRALLPPSWPWAWSSERPAPRLCWYVCTDRGVYRPGETVRAFGWLRTRGPAPLGALHLPEPGTALDWQLLDPGAAGRVLDSGRATLSEAGGFQICPTLPEHATPGTASLVSVAISPTGQELGRDHTSVRIGEVRRPGFEVHLDPDAGPHLLGDRATVRLSAEDYTGEPLPGARVDWRVRAEAAPFAPPGREGFRFGPAPHPGPADDHLAALTDPHGQHSLGLRFEALPADLPPGPLRIVVEGEVQDAVRETRSAQTSLLLHPASICVGLRAHRGFVERGEPVEFEILTAELDGSAAPGVAVTVEPEGSDALLVTTDADGRARTALVPTASGRLRIRASARDPQGRPTASELGVWVRGSPPLPDRRTELGEIRIIADDPAPTPGRTVRLLVQAPFSPASGLLILRREGLVSAEPIALDGPTETLEVPILGAHAPGLTVQVELAGADSDGVAHASGTLRLDIPPRTRTLSVRLDPGAGPFAPGSQIPLSVEVRGEDGAPVEGAELAVAVVDEASLALTGASLPDPVAVFYAAPHDPTSTARLRDLVARRPPNTALPPRHQPATITVREPRPAHRPTEMLLLGDEPPAPAPTVRTDFSATALFATGLRTGPDGRTELALHLPDTATRYRAMAVAVAGADRFGTGRAEIATWLPLAVRPALPRLLRLGDRIELPVVVHNATDAPEDVAVAVRSTHLRLDGRPAAGRRVLVPPRTRVALCFEAIPTAPGDATVQACARSGRLGDAVALPLPVRLPSSPEVYATHGALGPHPLSIPASLPGPAWPGSALEIDVDSTRLAGLSDAVAYLWDYPHACTEQLASRIIAVTSLRNVLAAMPSAGLPSPEVLRTEIARDLDRLASRQQPSGGFGFWGRDSALSPFVSIHAARALAAAAAAGHLLPARTLHDSLRYLEQPLDLPDCSPQSRRFLAACALDVRRLLGRPAPDAAASLLAELDPDGLDLASGALLLPTLPPAERRPLLARLDARVARAGPAVHVVTGATDGAHVLLHSDLRTDALVLGALLEVDPDNDLIGGLVHGLLAHQRQGRWRNTQENAFALLALGRYFARCESEPPATTLRIRLGSEPLAERTFLGHGGSPLHATAPLPRTPQPLVLSRDDGPGRLYYRIGTRYAPRHPRRDAVDRGFAVGRIYEALDDPADVREEGPGIWRIRPGAAVRIRLVLAAPLRRHHVALVDPLPAGLEAVEPDLATTAHRHRSEAALAWYDHHALRDDRVEVFASLLPEGIYSYTCTARATTPGRYVTPPTRAEEMYTPETWGRSAWAEVIVG